MQSINYDKILGDITELIEKLQPNIIDSEESTESFQRALKEIFNRHNLSSDVQPVVKTVSILISDIRGFTSITERYSNIKVIDLLNKYFQLMGPIIEKYGGVIDKYMGDSIMAFFDESDDLQGSILNTLACALEMQIAMKEVNEYSKIIEMENFYMGIGINTGKVVSSTIGSDNYRENTVIGDQVNIAARVEAFSLRGQILLSENTYEPVKKFLTIGESNVVQAKGKSKPITIYELLAISRPIKLQSPDRDGRKSPRVDVDLPSNYQIVEGKKVMPEVFNATIMDLSYGGMSLKTNQKINKLSELKLAVTQSLMAAEYSTVYAKVRRIKEIDGEYEISLEFTSINDDAKYAIKSIVDSKI